MNGDAPDNASKKKTPSYLQWRFWAGSLISLLAVLAVGFGIWQASRVNSGGNPLPPSRSTAEQSEAASINSSSLPAIGKSVKPKNVQRVVDPHTDIPERVSSWVSLYTVQHGDTVTSIAEKYDLKPESIFFANTDTLQDDPNLLKPGQVLFILPIDGAFYRWKEGDILEQVALDFSVTVDAIVNWPGNEINPLDPKIAVGDWLIIPGGTRPYQWEAPMVQTGKSTSFAEGPNVCPPGYGGTAGTDAWVWPTDYHYLSPGGYDFGPGHGGIDIAVGYGDPIYAAQAGVIVYNGGTNNGYGILVIIDHLNHWHTFYAHLSQTNVYCGEQVWAGTPIGLAGITGRSSGPHLHFEMRYYGQPQNPWGLLPPS
jgi:murein DD-endopeptidase MepM/ murein hydrolase activator NlpD